MNRLSCVAGAEYTWPRRYSPIGAPHTSNKLNPAKQVEPRRTDRRVQVNKANVTTRHECQVIWLEGMGSKYIYDMWENY